MAKQKTWQMAARVDDHAQDTEIHLTRRQALTATALGFGGAAVGTVVTASAITYPLVGFWDWLHLKIEFKPKFLVRIYSKEELEQSTLSDDRKKLVAESKLSGYIRVGYKSGDPLVKVHIYGSGPQTLDKSMVDGEYVRIPRILGDGTYTYVVSSPSLGSQRKRVATPHFLTDLELLEKIVEADKLEHENYKKRHRSFPSFIYWADRIYKGLQVPTQCSIQIKGDPVHYRINGLEQLVGGDKTLFAEYWLEKNKFTSYNDFLDSYRNNKEISVAESVNKV